MTTKKIWLGAAALLILGVSPSRAQVEAGGVHIGPGGVTVREKGGTTVITNGGVRTMRRTRHQIVRRGARSFVLNDNGVRRTLAVNGGSVVVNGNHGVYTLTGGCGSLVLNGNDNRLRVIGALQSAVANGSRNQVIYTSGRRPAVTTNGDGNTISVSQ